LPNIDLANVATLDLAVKRAKLQSFKAGHAPYSLHAFQCLRPDIVNAQFPLLPPAEPTPWPEIERRIRQLADPGAEAETCVELARSYHEFAGGGGFKAIFHGHAALKLGAGRGFDASFWEPYVLTRDGRILIVFIDARRSGGLNSGGLRFAWSMMHEGLRAIDPDIAEAELLILRFGKSAHSKKRPLRPLQPGSIQLYNLAELDAMVGETYRVWEEVLRDRRDEPPPEGTGTDGWWT